MSVIAEIIDTLELKVKKLIFKIIELENDNEKLTSELSQSAKIIAAQAQKIEQQNALYETLKTTNALLGSDENKRETKLKINSLIR
jgi:septal ring factor EnvC (AmiA/AmiB activator)